MFAVGFGSVGSGGLRALARRAGMAVGVVLVLTLSPATFAQDDGGAGAMGVEDTWNAVVLPEPTSEGAITTPDALVTGIAVGPDSVVAVGGRVCRGQSRGPARCWGQAWTSTDGISWQSVDPISSGLELGRSRPVLSGPEIGVEGVTYGPAGFLAYGRVESRNDGQVPAVWRSDDGSSWARLTADDSFPRGARMRAILGADDGYLLGGVVYARTPRAAIWSSVDGSRWSRARGSQDDETFEIGGYIDTMEDPMSGGVSAFSLYPGPDAANGMLADGVVAVGQACAPAIDREQWAWNGACEGRQWRSSDGLTWKRGEMAQSRGPATAVTAVRSWLAVAAPICWGDCSSAILRSADGTRWEVAYGSPVGGEIKALASMRGRLYAVVAVPETFPQGPATLALWSSSDGTEWTFTEAQPPMPLGAMWLNDVDMVALGDRLLVTASGTEGLDELGGSVTLLSPALP